MSQPPTTERRRSRRRKPLRLVYLEFGRENGGMVKDVSEGGMRFYLMNPVAVGQTLQFTVNLDAARRIEGQAKMIWTETNGKSGGMSFAQISDQSRETLRAWLAEIDGPTAAPLTAAAPAVPLTPPRVPPDPVPAPSAISAPAAQVPASQSSAMQGPAVQSPAVQSPAVQAAVAESPASTVQPELVPAASIPLPPAPPAPPPVASVPVAQPPAQSIPAPSSAAQVAAAPNPAPPIPVPPVPPAKAPPQSRTDSLDDARPVTREDWIRAARENLVPGDRSARSSLPPATFATPPPPPSARPSASANPGSMNEELQSLVSTILFDKKPPEATATAKFERIAQAVDPLREFLRRPPEDTAIARAPAEHLPTLDDRESKPSRGGWTASRLFLVFSFAAICGLAAAFAAIAYRQTLGESLIELGQRIGGPSRSSAPANADRSPASPTSAVDLHPTLSPADTPQPSNTPATAPPPSGNSSPASSSTSSPANSPAAQPAATPQPTSPISQFRPQSIQPSAIPQPELAAGREIIPGKPKRLPQDVASLWIAVENGDTLAEVHLADRYISGYGVEKNCDQARVLLQAAAKHGDELAAKRLAHLAISGCQ
jgi:hypothetical protein